MPDYGRTIRYWDNVFAEGKAKIKEPLYPEEVEEGLLWLCAGAESAVDFGCDSGRALFRCLERGGKSGVGIDISRNAVSLAENAAKDNGLADRCEFIHGDVSVLKSLPACAFDGALFLNVIDNMPPDDARRALTEIKRLVKPEGRILLKINDHYDPSYLVKSRGYRLISSGNFYQKPAGLYLWNLSDDEVRGLLEPELEIKRFVRVKFDEREIVNRFYRLRRNHFSTK